MYKIQPIVQVWPDLNLPQTMYNMKTIVNLKLEDSSAILQPNISVELTEIDHLAARQEKILLQIEEFRKQLASIKNDLHLKSGNKNEKVPIAKAQSISTTKPIVMKNVQEVIVNVNPDYVPYSILGIKKLWTDRLAIDVTFYTHSSITNLPENAKKFEENFKSSAKSKANLPFLKITLIWKNVEKNLEVITSATTYSPILGEVNLIRLLCRFGPPEYNYEESDDAFEIDSTLDACYLLFNALNLKERLANLRILNLKLKKQPFFGNTSISILDVAVSSTIHQLNILKDLPPALSAWLTKVKKQLNY